jgi:hypothetical protein
MNRDEFYKNKSIIEIERRLGSCNLPGLSWGRVRVFDDGTADACFDKADKLYGFENREFAGYLLSEDEYIRFGKLDEEDEKAYEIILSRITPPIWDDEGEQNLNTSAGIDKRVNRLSKNSSSGKPLRLISN